MHPVSRLIALSAVGATAVAALAAPAQADSLRGDCRYKGTTFAFVDGAVFKEPDSFDDKVIETVIALTTFAIDKHALAATVEKSKALNDQGYGIDESRRLELRLADGKVGTMFFNGPGSSVSMSGGDIGKFQTRTNDAQRIAGEFVLEGDDDDLRCDVGFDLAFATTTQAAAGGAAAKAAAPAAMGKALPAGGGEPGKVFQANLAAMQKGDVDAMLATVTKAQGDKMRAQRKDPQFGAMLEMMKAFAPKSATVTGGQDFGDTAELTIDAVDPSGKKSGGTSTLRKEGGAWKVEKTSMKSGM